LHEFCTIFHEVCPGAAPALAFALPRLRENSEVLVKINRVLLSCAALFFALPARADGIGERNDPDSEAGEGGGMLWVEGEGDEPWLAPQVSTEVDLVVTGMIARARVEQVFENPSEEAVEAVYVFPLPDDAAVDGLTLTVGERRIVGEVREREDAERRYERAANAGKKASLVSQERPNVFTTSVANIGPGELVSVRITYQQDVRYDHGEFSLLFPSTLTPRYNPGGRREDAAAPLLGALGKRMPAVAGSRVPGVTGSRVLDAARITPPVLLDGSGPLFDVKVALDAGFSLETIDSPSHAIDVDRSPSGSVAISLGEGPVIADRDFRLRWRPKASKAPSAAVFTEEFAGERYALLMLVPPQAGAEQAPSLPRETTFVIDTSGSMAGTSITQAVASLRTGLAALAPGDSFNVIEFNSSAQRLFDTSRPASRENVARALEWVEGLRADGGTEILDALQLALGAPGRSERVQQVVFITDGSVGNEDELFRFIRERLGERRLFTVGIGSAPNRHFMRGAARFGRGAFTEVSSLADVSTQLDALWAKLDAPVMRDVALQWQGATPETWPRRAPDLYRGEPLVLLAKLGRDTRAASLSGVLAGQPFTLPIALDRPARESGIHRLWARRQIEALMDAAVEGRDEASIRAAVVPLALRHHLVSKYTSLVAVDTRASVDGRAPRASVGVALPAGNEMFGQLPQTATPGPFCLVFGALSFVASVVVQRRIIL
jgi:Ca-activated chloride channel family protein